MDEVRLGGAKLALLATVGLAVVLVGRALLDAPWLGGVAVVLLFVALIGREFAIFGRQTGYVLAVVAGVVLIAAAVEFLR